MLPATSSQSSRIRGLAHRLAQLEDAAAKLPRSSLDTAVKLARARTLASVAAPTPTESGWPRAQLKRAEALSERIAALECSKGMWGEAGLELVRIWNRVDLLEKGVLIVTSQPTSRDKSDAPTRRVVSSLREMGLDGKFDLLKVPDAKDYYEKMTLEDRAVMLGAPSPAHLCKTLLMQAGDQYILVVLQYEAQLDAAMLRDGLKDVGINIGSRPKVAQEDEAASILGFPPNGTAPVGLRQGSGTILVVAEAVTKLRPPIVYMGGGEADVKLRVQDVHEFVKAAGALVLPVTTKRVLGKEGALFQEEAKPKAQAAPAPAASSGQKASSKPPAKKGGAGSDGEDDAAGPAAAAGAIDFNALDVRVGKIVKAWRHEASDKLMCEEIDVGEPTGPRSIASGIQKFYTPEQVQGHSVLVVCNLKPAKLGGFPSNGMVLCASWQNDAGEQFVKFVEPPPNAAPGTRIVCKPTAESAVIPPFNANMVKKKKVMESVAEKLQLGPEGRVDFDGVQLVALGDENATCVVPNGPVGAKVT